MREIRPLTSLRGLAALAVVMQHFSTTAQQLCDTAIYSLVPHGYIAVDLFFVLSGFIMSYTYLGGFKEHGWAAFPDFLARRVARIVPLNVAVLIVLMFCAAGSVTWLGHNIFFRSDSLPADFIANIFMLQGLGIGTNLNRPSWSISTEFAAYLLFPFFLIVVFNARRWCLGVLILSAAGLCWVALQHPRLALDSDDSTTAQQVLRCFTEFVMGMAAFRLYRKERVGRLLGTDFSAFALAFACCGFLVLRLDLPAALLFPFLIVSQACNRGRMARVMSMRVPYFLGVISYSIYLIHSPFRPVEFEIVRALHPGPLPPAAALSFAMIGSLSVIPFAWIAYRLVERPGRNVIRWLFAGRRADAALST